MSKISIKLDKDNLQAVSDVFGEPKRILKRQLKADKKKGIHPSVVIYELPEGQDAVMAGLLFHSRMAELKGE